MKNVVREECNTLSAAVIFFFLYDSNNKPKNKNRRNRNRTELEVISNRKDDDRCGAVLGKSETPFAKHKLTRIQVVEFGVWKDIKNSTVGL